MKKVTREQLKKRNERFHKMSPAKQRVAVAKDVLEQLRIGKFVAESGTYFNAFDKTQKGDVWGNRAALPEGILKIKGGQRFIEQEQVGCAVCARGAVFASRCRLGNDVLNPMLDEDCDTFFREEGKTTQALFPYFGTLESLFERGRNAFNHDEVGEMVMEKRENACERWMDAHANKTDRRRMTLLMQNIIKNNGDLKLYGVKM